MLRILYTKKDNNRRQSPNNKLPYILRRIKNIEIR